MTLVTKDVKLNTMVAVPSRTRLTIAEDITFNDWRELLETVIRMEDSSDWWVGDALAYGERFRRDYPAALEAIDRSYSYHANRRWVSTRVETRYSELSWTHHRLVASLDPDQQTRWLDDAARHGWSTRELEAAIAADTQRADRPPALNVRAVGDLYQVCIRAAEHAGMEPAAWATAALERAARMELEA